MATTSRSPSVTTLAACAGPRAPSPGRQCRRSVGEQAASSVKLLLLDLLAAQRLLERAACQFAQAVVFPHGLAELGQRRAAATLAAKLGMFWPRSGSCTTQNPAAVDARREQRSPRLLRALQNDPLDVVATLSLIAKECRHARGRPRTWSLFAGKFGRGCGRAPSRTLSFSFFPTGWRWRFSACHAGVAPYWRADDDGYQVATEALDPAWKAASLPACITAS